MTIPYLKTQISSVAGVTASEVLGVADNQGEWDDLTVPLSGVSQPSDALTAPVMMKIMDSIGGAGTGGVWGWGFVNTREDDLLFSAQLPHSYRQGSDMLFHVHWTMVTATTGTVRWGLEYAWSNIDGSFKITKLANAATTRQRDGAGTGRLTFTTAHGLVTGQNIVVAGAADGAYNKNTRVTNFSDAGTFWIEYPVAGAVEAPAVDAGVNVAGYTIVIEQTATLAADSKWKHMLTPMGTIYGQSAGVNKRVSHMLICRFYRPVLGGHIAERIPAIAADFHILKDTNGSIAESSK